MKQTVDFYDFRRAFEQCRPDNFSRQGLEVLWDYLEQYEEGTGEEIELDVIALCCDYSEDTVEDIANNYGIDLVEVDEDEQQEYVRDYLEAHTTLVGETPTGFVYACF